jgi:Trypsin/Bacterial pre-peptidase C-terminal domain
MRLLRRSTLLLVALTLATAGPARARNSDLAQPRIVNGELTGLYPTTGALLRGGSNDTADAWCSGTLIGCQTFLTASHCVEGLGPQSFRVFLPHAGFFTVTSIAMHPDFDFPNADVAVLKLATAVNGIPPTPINTTGAPPPGTPAIIAGYGRSGDPNFDYGLKRFGAVTTASCDSSVPNGGSDATLVCWNFVAPLGPPGSNSNTCNADSGGPLFVDFGQGDVVAGTTSGGKNFSCLAGDHSYDANVFTYRTFIQTQGGADLANTTCGTLPQIGDPGSSVLALSGTLGSGNPEDTHAIQVSAGTNVLRVGMNANDDGLSDFDLYVKAGSPPTTSDYDCRAIGSNQYGFCEFQNPTPGPWYVMASRFAGAGTYQLTITTFGLDCSNPANDGVPCNDGNPCTSGDVCQSGSCSGSAVLDDTPCDDGDACTQPDGCQAGVCVGTVPVDCKQPVQVGKTLLKLDDKTPDSRDKLSWHWRGDDTLKAEFGTPTAGTSYVLCVYDETAGVPALVLRQTMPAGGAWKENRRGFRYRDSKLLYGGIKSLSLKEGLGGKASISVSGKGASLAMPSLPLNQDDDVIVRLLNGATCWETRYDSSIINQSVRFKAKND